MTKAQIQTLVFAAVAVFAFAPKTASAYEYKWIYVGENKELLGMTGEDEGDTDFRATCQPNKHAAIGIGAAEDVGTGKGEAVSITLKAGTRTLRIDGKSHNSANFEMTGGVELETEVDGKHEVFELLAGPGTIKVAGTTRPASWPDKGRAAATKKFVKACFGG